jgi:protein gp37
VPCWVREMDGTEAYMELVKSNTQSELTPLERGFHALRSPLDCKGYAKETGRARTSVQKELHAAEVATAVPDIGHGLSEKVHHLVEIHVAPEWLWSALVERLLADSLTVDGVQRVVKRIGKLDPPPAWADGAVVAKAIAGDTMRPADIARMLEAVAKAKLEADDLRQGLEAALVEERPGSLSQTQAIVAQFVNRQADRDRAQREMELHEQRQRELATARASRLKNSCSLTDWKELSRAERVELLAPDGSQASFNEQDNAAIEWAQWSWNPVTGCLHDCPYCYARDIANQRRMAEFYPAGFEPSIRSRVLLAPRGRKPPPQAAADARYRNVFTCSMADLFGRWVPKEWIEAVLAEVRSAPSWNFLFLTKFPKRMAEFDLPTNAWMGTTVDLQARVPAAEAAFARVASGVRWLSVEPMLEPLRFKRLDLFQWVVIGGASKSSKTPEWRPPYAWIHDLVQQARDAGCKVYFKTNLLGAKQRILELPFDAPVPAEAAELPEVFRYLGKAA